MLQRKILAYFKEGGRLTVNKALHLFCTTELRKVVSRLRRAGHNIASRWQYDTTNDGRHVRYKEYYLITE
jgi:hypothetical protein